MKLRIGDKVRLLNEVGEGIVSRIRDREHVFVEMPDGFEIPFHVSQLVPIHTELIRSDTENIALDPSADTADAIYFVVEPDSEMDQFVSDLKIYLFNASSFNLMYAYSIRDEDYFQTLKHGEAGAFQKVLLRQVKMQFFNDYPFQKIDCLLFKNSFFRYQEPVSVTLHLTPEKLRKAKRISHEEFRFPVYGFVLKDSFVAHSEKEPELTEEDLQRVRAIKEFRQSPKVSRSNKEYLKSLEKEVDLHINELVDDAGGMSNYEMLSIQLERFEKELDAALAGNVRKIIFIHGVGNGRLKQEIISILKDTEGVTFHDAPFKQYGYGATQVNIL